MSQQNFRDGGDCYRDIIREPGQEYPYADTHLLVRSVATGVDVERPGCAVAPPGHHCCLLLLGRECLQFQFFLDLLLQFQFGEAHPDALAVIFTDGGGAFQGGLQLFDGLLGLALEVAGLGERQCR